MHNKRFDAFVQKSLYSAVLACAVMTGVAYAADATQRAPHAAVPTSASALQLLDPVKKVVVRQQLRGLITDVKPTGEVVAELSGPLYAARVNLATGMIASLPGPRVGRIDRLKMTFFLGLTKENYPTIFLNNPQPVVRFTYDDIAIAFDDGARLTALLDNPATVLIQEADIPMEGRLLLEFGPIGGTSPSLIRLRGIGCAGVKETARSGFLAGTRGALCVNGTFSFPSAAAPGFPTTAEQFQSYLVELIGQPLRAESDLTIVTHSLLSGLP